MPPVRACRWAGLVFTAAVAFAASVLPTAVADEGYTTIVFTEEVGAAPSLRPPPCALDQRPGRSVAS